MAEQSPRFAGAPSLNPRSSAMSRLRTIVPLILTSLTPALGGTAAAPCSPINWSTPACEAERDREFAAARNAEINASIAAVAAARSKLARSLTHCKTADSTTPRCEAERTHELALELSHCKLSESTTPRCEAERAREFAAAQNAAINASIARVAHARWLASATTHCKTADSTTPRCEAERAREFAAAQNAAINASIAMVKAVREREFAAARNAEINAALAAVQAERERQFAADQNAKINASIAMVEFVRTQNAAIDRSIAAVKAARDREFAAARNAEINASIAAVKAERERTFAAEQNAAISASIAMVEFTRARNAEIEASLAIVKAAREREFAAARNTEINASIAAVQARRAIEQAAARAEHTGLETGALPLPQAPVEHLAPTLKHSISTTPCGAAAEQLGPLHFPTTSALIDNTMRPQFERLAEIARNCPAVQIEIHGHATSLGPVHFTRNLAERRAQATRDYLAELGVDKKRMEAVGHGDREPVALMASNASNDRVEIVIKDPALDLAASRIMMDLAELLEPAEVPAVARLSP
jgi:outer membrane protein OmpA-like peptidoglycan-associated protein